MLERNYQDEIMILAKHEIKKKSPRKSLQVQALPKGQESLCNQAQGSKRLYRKRQTHFNIQIYIHFMTERTFINAVMKYLHSL